MLQQGETKMREKVEIWGASIPYNTGTSKLHDMTIRKKLKIFATVDWIRDVFGTHIMADTAGLDTYTYLDEIKPGKISEKYDDAPTLTPFIAEGSVTAVIIAPGGGFCNQSRKWEGYDIARFLKQNGISAFVLDYRLNPYRAPVCYLDMQRAIRYVRHHAGEYGIHKEKIGVLGFSAGGYVAGASHILLGNQAVTFPGYVPDAVDAEDGQPSFLGLVYPVVSFDENPNMLAILAGKDFFDDGKRKLLMKEYSLIEHLQHSNVPQFLCYGSKDMLEGMDRYDAKMEELNIPHQTLVLEGAGHGFNLSNKKYAFWGDEFIRWIRRAIL